MIVLPAYIPLTCPSNADKTPSPLIAKLGTRLISFLHWASYSSPKLSFFISSLVCMTVFQESALWLNNYYTKNFAKWKIAFICFTLSTHTLPGSGTHYLISSACKYHLQSLVRYTVSAWQNCSTERATSEQADADIPYLSHQWVMPPVTLFIQDSYPASIHALLQHLQDSAWFSLISLPYPVIRNPWWWHSFPLPMFCNSNFMIMWQGIHFIPI